MLDSHPVLKPKPLRAARRGGFKRGGFPIWTCPSFFGIVCPFFPMFSFLSFFLICPFSCPLLSLFVLFLSFFVLLCPFWDFPDFSGIFPICSRMVRGFSRFVPFLFLGFLRAPTRNSPERVRDTIWTFPEKVGNPLV